MASALVPAPRTRPPAGDALARVVQRVLGPGAHRVVALGDLLAGVVSGRVDAVRACDDEFPRLAHERALQHALRTARQALRPGGMLVAAVPELGRLRRLRTAAPPPSVVRSGDDREVTVQVWDWAEDGESYGLEVIRLVRHQGSWEIGEVAATRHRVLSAEETGSRLADAGFRGVRRLTPTEAGHRVPVWIAGA